MDHRGPRRPACGGAPLKHLDGQARCKVLAQAPVARAIAGDVLGLLLGVWGPGTTDSTADNSSQ